MTMTKAASYWDQITAQRISRRRALQMAAVGGASAAAIAFVGCSSSSNKDKTPGTAASPSGGGAGTPKTGGTLKGTVSLVLGKDQMKQVTFKLKEPFGLFLNRIASFQDLWIMPKEFIESSENAAEDRMLGSGAFIFDHYTPNVEMAWTKNPSYFEKDKNGQQLPYLDG